MAKKRAGKQRSPKKRRETHHTRGGANHAPTVLAAFFSPTGGTKQATLAVAEGVGQALGASISTFDFTTPEEREWKVEFGRKEVVILGMPTYAGRLPNKILPFLRDQLLGEHTLVLPLVTYGGRAYENSLAELVGILQDNGFLVAAAAAAVCQHAFVKRLATGRPSQDDRQALREFGKRAGALFASLYKGKGASVEEDTMATLWTEDMRKWSREAIPGNTHPEEYYTPVDLKGTPTVFLKAKPVLRPERCTGCRACAARCAMGCIQMQEDALQGGSRPIFEGTCIKCHGCIRHCPEQALQFTDEALARHIRMLEATYGEAERSNEYYLYSRFPSH